MPLLTALVLLCAQALAGPTLAHMTLSHQRKLNPLARDVLEVRVAMSPDVAANAGLFDDADQVPSYAPAVVEKLAARLERDLERMAALPWQSWPIDDQIDLRWTYAVALEGRRRLLVERIYTHRPAEWLEPVANSYLALLTYAPERTELRTHLTAQLPAMLDELRVVVTAPTARDVTIALGLLDSLNAMVALDPPGPGRDAALAALAAYGAHLRGLHDLPDYAVIGEANYAWRLKHFLLLPWTPDELLARAEAELARVDAALAELQPMLEPPPLLSPDEAARAGGLDQAGLLQLYDGLVANYLQHIRDAGVLTVPPGVGPMRARPTPEALIPLSGDGGSMNPAPTFVSDPTGWWNVEHVPADWPQADREQTLLRFLHPAELGMGPYAAHEGVPGHHLQLSIARLNPDPLRSIFTDNVSAEGWALYAEQLFWEVGGFGTTRRAEANMLRSYRHRIRRVVYDVHIETGRWTLQQGADYKYGTGPGAGQIEEEVMRSINWPTQLICYFAGKTQILELRARAEQTAGMDPTHFHDVLLGTGTIPLVFAEAKLFGTPLPPLEPRADW